MLYAYLKAENMKFKHSLFRKLTVLIPLVLILIAMVFMFVGIGLGGFSSSIVCNWSMPIASLSIMFLCHQVNNKEKKHQYRTIYSLPIDLKNTFISKTILVSLNLLVISFLLSCISIVSEFVLSGFSVAIGYIGYYILGYTLLWFSLLWQIPLCLFLDQKVGFITSLILNLFLSAFGGLFFALTPIFWIFPYSWTARLMTTLFGVLPNGLLVESGSRYILSLGQSSVLVLISIFIGVIFTLLFSVWYGKQVYRK